jgi:hypothetical protein
LGQIVGAQPLALPHNIAQFRSLKQGMTEWCWAAVSSLTHSICFNRTPPLSQIAVGKFTNTNFGDPPAEQWNQQKAAYTVISALGVPDTGPPSPYRYVNLTGMLLSSQLPALRLWFSAGRRSAPVQIKWAPPNSGQHWIAIAAHDAATDIFCVYDPGLYLGANDHLLWCTAEMLDFYPFGPAGHLPGQPTLVGRAQMLFFC